MYIAIFCLLNRLSFAVHTRVCVAAWADGTEGVFSCMVGILDVCADGTPLSLTIPFKLQQLTENYFRSKNVRTLAHFNH